MFAFSHPAGDLDQFAEWRRKRASSVGNDLDGGGGGGGSGGGRNGGGAGVCGVTDCVKSADSQTAVTNSTTTPSGSDHASSELSIVIIVFAC